MQPVAVVIPTLDEEGSISAAIESARRAGAAEIVIADGGSTDHTIDLARSRGASVVVTEPVRGRQLNAGAAATNAGIVLFLHGDTTLPADAVRQIDEAVSAGSIFGGFRISFAESDWRLRLAAALINARCAISRCPWGDQAQWIVREHFDSTGGYRDDPIMEDYEMAIRMKRRGQTVILPTPVVTSGRRFLHKGLLRTAIINWRVVIGWRMGVEPEHLAALYRG